MPLFTILVSAEKHIEKLLKEIIWGGLVRIVIQYQDEVQSHYKAVDEITFNLSSTIAASLPNACQQALDQISNPEDSMKCNTNQNMPTWSSQNTTQFLPRETKLSLPLMDFLCSLVPSQESSHPLIFALSKRSKKANTNSTSKFG